jgi:pimeloyl-[acyl-carrier protein] methyl ester esterase
MKNNSPLVLIRGLVREQGHWGPFVSQLQKTFPSNPLIFLDLPGAGDWYQEKTPKTITEIVHFMRSKAQRNPSWNQRPQKIFLSISLGSMITSEWITQYPDDIEAAIMINTSFSNLSGPFARLQPSALLKLFTCLGKPIELKEKIILDVVLNHPEKRVELLPHWIAIQKKRPVTPANTLRQLMAAGSYKSPKSYPQPEKILILSSKGDRMVSPQCSRQIANHYKLKHPTGGHELCNDEPTWVCEQIKNWLTSTPLSLL